MVCALTMRYCRFLLIYVQKKFHYRTKETYLLKGSFMFWKAIVGLKLAWNDETFWDEFISYGTNCWKE